MHVQNVHTMDELKLTGNCLKGSRGILSFDKGFDESEWGKLTKEVFTQVIPFFSFLSAVMVKLGSVIDFRCAINSTTGEAIRRSYSHILDPRF